MLDVHPPHHAATTWRDFFIHIATIVIGLLIAIGLEQTVEWFNHRHQVAGIRRDLAEERRVNSAQFNAATAEFRRYAPLLRGNLRVLDYIHQHPGAPAGKWPGRLSLFIFGTVFDDTAWREAQQSPALEYMPRAEVEDWRRFYAGLDGIAGASAAELQALFEARTYLLRAPNPQSLSPEQIDREYGLMLDAYKQLMLAGLAERNFSRTHSDFKNAPTDAEFYHLIPPAPDPEDVKAVQREQQEAAQMGRAGTEGK